MHWHWNDNFAYQQCRHDCIILHIHLDGESKHLASISSSTMFHIIFFFTLSYYVSIMIGIWASVISDTQKSLKHVWAHWSFEINSWYTQRGNGLAIEIVDCPIKHGEFPQIIENDHRYSGVLPLRIMMLQLTCLFLGDQPNAIKDRLHSLCIHCV